MISEVIFIFSGLMLVILVLIAIIVWLLLMVFRQKREAPTEDSSELDQDLISVVNKAKAPSLESTRCKWHKKEQAVGICAICESGCCEVCLKDWDGLYFCPEHFKTYANHKWTSITNVKTTPDNSDKATAIYKFKKSLWVEEQIPTFIVTHYRINVEEDYIESYVMLHVREEDCDPLKERLVSLEQ